MHPFTEADLNAAADLLAARPETHPLVAPYDPRAEIEALLAAGHTGYATHGGYLLGRVDGGEAWVQYAGHAAGTIAIYRQLYAAIARDWVTAGAYRHCVVMPDGDRLAGYAFADLAFGREHVFSLASLDAQPQDAPLLPVRVATIEDYDALAPMFGMLARHLEGSPVFSPRPASYWDTILDDFREDMADPDSTYLTVWDGETCVGFSTWGPMPPRIAVPDGAWALGHMVVLPEYRNRGYGQAMTLAGLALLRERGVTVSWCDWRLTNLDAEPYWRTYGWTPYLARMTRRIEPPA